jgi:hypothetical protein
MYEFIDAFMGVLPMLCPPPMFEILCLLMTLFMFNLQGGNQILKQIPCKNLIMMFQLINNLVLKKAFK